MASTAWLEDGKVTTPLDELRRDGVLQRFGEHYETTRRWRAARHRASAAREPASDRTDSRNPIVQALLAFYGRDRTIAAVERYVSVLFALECTERIARQTPR
jgi:hypothetical protein